ncbi:hypothetical protein R6Q59_015540 [Mikania micrantha]
MISFAECLDSIPSQLEYYSWSGFKSRFAAGPYHYKNMKVKARVKPQFLSPQIIYTVNLVFMFAYPKKPTKSHEYICLKHKLQGENQSSISYLAYEREDGWWMCELYQLTSDHRTVDLEILFDGFHSSYNVIGAEGIEFWPLEKVEHKDEKQPIIYSDANWEEKLPTNYVDIIKWSKNSVQWTTKKEAYSIICKGFLLSDGQEWFSLDNNGKKCHMLSARVAGISTGECIDEKMDWMPLHESRFGEVLECDFWKLRIDTKIQSQLLSSLTTYVSYLVYKLPETQFGSEAPLLVNDSVSDWSSIMDKFSALVKSIGKQKWFSINKKGEHHEMISIAECLDNSSLRSVTRRYRDKFAVGSYDYFYHAELKTHVKSQLLSPLTTYMVNLVFSIDFFWSKCQPINLEYRLQGETKTSVSYLAYKIEDGMLACELFQFTSDSQFVDLEIVFEGFDEYYESIFVQGIEFRPMEKQVEHKDENQTISDSDAYCEEELPADYEDIMKRSTDILQWTTKKEAYSIIRKGFLIDDGEKWFFLDKKGKKCHKLSAAYISAFSKEEIDLSESRFKEAALLSSSGFCFRCEIESHLLSPQTTYATYLVYKYLPENQSRFEGPMVVRDNLVGADYWYVYLVSPTTPVIRPKTDQNTHNPVHRPKIKCIPQQRNDGWIEVQIWEFRTAATIEMVPIDFYVELARALPYKKFHIDYYMDSYNNIPSFEGLVIQGFEVRPT